MDIQFIDPDLPLALQGRQPPSSMVLVWNRIHGPLPKVIDGTPPAGLRQVHAIDKLPVGTEVLSLTHEHWRGALVIES
jgi:hypothetical protein